VRFAYFKKESIRNDFLLELIQGIGSVDEFTACHGKKADFIARFDPDSFDCIIVRGFFEILDHHTIALHENLIIVPDFEDFDDEITAKSMLNAANARFLCFSSYLHQNIAKYNKKALYVQYYPPGGEDKTEADDLAFNVLVHFDEHFSLDAFNTLLSRIRVNKAFIRLAEDTLTSPSILGLFPGCDAVIADDENIDPCNLLFTAEKGSISGTDFIGAMNRGMLVVAPNVGLFKETISSGTNGYLYDPADHYPLDFIDPHEMRQRAKDSVARGAKRWADNVNGLIRFIQNTDIDASAYRLEAMWNQRKNDACGENGSTVANGRGKVSVVTVCRNAEHDIERTIQSVISQDYPNLEYLVLDGDSGDGTVGRIRKYADHIAYWHSRPDSGVYPTMLESLNILSGEWVIFMNAGDTFVSPDAISRLFKTVPDDVAVLYGHHIYRSENGVNEIHVSADFNTTWYRLINGYLSFDWLGGMPCHQSVSTRVSVLKELGFDTNYKIAADHDFYFRAKEKGYKFFNSDELISIYVGGGLSAQKFTTCVQEWRAISAKFGRVDAVNRFYDQFNTGAKPQSRYDILFRKVCKGLRRLFH